jgi:hypothetical protein
MRLFVPALCLCATSAAAGQKATGSWKAPDVQKDAAGRSSVTLELVSSVAIRGETGNVMPSVIIRCDTGVLVARISGQTLLDVKSDRTPVRFSWDNEPTEASQMWRVSGGMDEIIVPDPSKFVSKLVQSLMLRVDIKPSGRNAGAAVFAPAGMLMYRSLLTSACPKAGLDSAFGIVEKTAEVVVAAPPPAPAATTPVPVKAPEIYKSDQVEQPVRVMEGTLSLHYPDEFRRSGGPGNVLAQFVVDTNGVADMTTFRALKSDHALFTKAVRDAVMKAKFYPAEIAGSKKVRQVVESNFSFKVPVRPRP